MKRPLLVSLILSIPYFLIGQHIYDDGFNHLQTNNYTAAKEFFYQAIKTAPEDKTAQICYGRALGLGGEQAVALEHFEKLVSSYSEDYEIELNYAEALMWNNEFEIAETYYANLVKKDPDNFVANYGYANALSSNNKFENALYYNQKALQLDPLNDNVKFARKHILLAYAYNFYLDREFDKADRWIDTLNAYYPSESKALQLESLIKAKKQVSMSGEHFSSKDDFGNRASGISADISIPIANKWTSKAAIKKTKTEFLREASSSSQKSIQLFAQYFPSRKFEIELAAGVNLVSFPTKRIYHNSIGHASILYRPFDSYFVSAEINKETYNYTTELLKKNIERTNLTLTQHYSTKSTLGFYSQAQYSRFSDANKSINLFGSVYYDFKSHPLKAGFNVNYIAYQEQRAELYFSPSSYHGYEAFVGLDNSHLDQALKCRITFAYGIQKQEMSSYRQSWRAELELRYPIDKNLDLGITYKTSNIASSVAIGAYKSTEWKLGLQYRI